MIMTWIQHVFFLDLSLYIYMYIYIYIYYVHKYMCDLLWRRWIIDKRWSENLHPYTLTHTRICIEWRNNFTHTHGICIYIYNAYVYCTYIHTWSTESLRILRVNTGTWGILEKAKKTLVLDWRPRVLFSKLYLIRTQPVPNLCLTRT